MTPTLRIATGALTLSIASAGFAMGQDPGMDADGDGLVTYEEMAAIMPEMSEDMFMQLDADASGALDAEEILAAQEAGLLPA